jgi:hypothetical protein
VDELDGRVTDDVHGCTELSVGEGFEHAKVFGRAGEMREDDLSKVNEGREEERRRINESDQNDSFETRAELDE